MSRHAEKTALLMSAILGAFAIAETANAAGPYNNTAYGNAALGYLTTGTNDSAFGFVSQGNTTTGSDNASFGSFALYSNDLGSENSAVGSSAMRFNEGGGYNTAVGYQAAELNEAGGYNTALGANALTNNTTNGNTAVGAQALYANTTGGSNTAVGYLALSYNVGGASNTALGEEALYSNVNGPYNVALGRNALRNMGNGANNSVVGYASCWSCTMAGNNTTLGYKTLYNNHSGSSNIAVGPQAGFNITGSNNISIGNQGMPADNGVTRIGATSTQTQVFVAGISTTKLTGAAVYVTADGQLGVAPSSQRYKTDIKTLQDTSDKLQQLRPVTFHLKSDPKGLLQYGLIAEEVDHVFPDLVIRDAEGKIQGVHYEELAPLLLNEVQQQNARIQASDRQHAADMTALNAELDQQRRQMAVLQRQNDALLAVLSKLQGATPELAMR